MMMTTTEMNQAMQSFFEDYNGKNDEINRLNDELAAVKAELAKLGIEFDRVNIEFRKATDELGETRKELGETKEKLMIANAVIADIRPKERADFGIRSFKYIGETMYFATDLLHKKGYKNLNLRSVLGKKIYLAHAKKFRFSDVYDRIESGIRRAPSGEVWCVDKVGAQVILEYKKRENKPVSHDMKSEIIRLYEDGMNRNDIANETGCNYYTVCSVLSKNGYGERKKNIISDSEVTEIIRLYKNGMKRADIAREIGCCYETVRLVLCKNGYGRKRVV